MKTSNFDAIFAAVPMDKTAATVVGNAPDQYEPSFNQGRETFDYPPPIRMDAVAYSITDLRGVRCGFLTVLGLIGGVKKVAGGAKWVCRCVCGKYETRRAKALRNVQNLDDKCAYCFHISRLKFLSEVKSFGAKTAMERQLRDEIERIKERGSTLGIPPEVIANAVQERTEKYSFRAVESLDRNAIGKWHNARSGSS